MPALIALSTSSIYPETTSHGFEYASRLGFDAVEVMVGIDAASQDFAKVRSLRDYHEIPVCAVHAPCAVRTVTVPGSGANAAALSAGAGIACQQSRSCSAHAGIAAA